MKRILVFDAGGSPATNFVRSLRHAPEEFYLVGIDCDRYTLMRAETDKTYLTPKIGDKNYFKVINRIIKKEKIEFTHIQNDAELAFVIKNKHKFKNLNLFVPKDKTILTCVDKYESYKIWSKRNGLTQPCTLLVEYASDIEQMLKCFYKIWLRNISGAGGKGSLATNNVVFAKEWLKYHKGWGKFTASDCLTPNSITWSSIWKNGKLIVAQGRKRIYWELSKLTMSGISGATGTGITVSDKLVDKIAQKAILAIDSKPHGIFSVDMAYDKQGIPNPTEINIGRFFTTHLFFTMAGLNMPYIYVKLAYGENIPKIKKKINPLEPNLAWIRGIDFLPILTTIKEIKKNANSNKWK